MGPGFVVIFWLIIFGILGAVWLGLLGLVLLGWKKKWRWLKWTAGIPAILMAVVGVIIGSFLAYGFIDSMNPESAFKSAFDQEPSSNISGLESKVWWFADEGSVFLRFKADENTFRQLVPGDLNSKTWEEMKSEIPEDRGDGIPSWWNVKYAAEWKFFARAHKDRQTSGKKGFAYEIEYIAYNPTTKTAYYRFLGID